MQDNNYELSIQQSEYLNNFCSDSVPLTEYFPVFILAQGLLLVLPHFFWRNVFAGDFNSFTATILKIDRLHNYNYVEFSRKSYDLLQNLEHEFSTKRVIIGYLLKLIGQIVICVFSIIFSATVFRNYLFSFDCDVNIPLGHVSGNQQLNATIPCVYTNLRTLSIIRYIDYVLVVIAMVLLLCGLIWFFKRHTKELGIEEVVTFTFESFLPPSRYIFPSLSCNTLFRPRILCDLDFFVMKLFREDPHHGYVLRAIRIQKSLQQLCALEQGI